MKKALFIDRDGTLIVEPPVTFQVDTLEQLEFLPFCISQLAKISNNLPYELIMVTNQDGLGGDGYPQENFDRVQNKMLQILENEGVTFKTIHIDKHFEKDNSDTRKPGIGMLTSYLNGDYDLQSSFVIGDRETDILLAKNLGCKAIFIQNNDAPNAELNTHIALIAKNWKDISSYLTDLPRTVKHERNTKETQIKIQLNLDGLGNAQLSTGLGFFDHMLEQIARHGLLDLQLSAKGDLHIDEHHTIEDVGIALGEAFQIALGDKKGIERYGFCLPMDDCLAQVALDFGGRNWIEWDVNFKREKVGDMPTEMVFHFFKSFSDAAKCNLNIKAEGENEHHKIESIFKAFAKAIKLAKQRDGSSILPSTKGKL